MRNGSDHRYVTSVFVVATALSTSGCEPPKSAAEACRRQAAGNRIGRSFSNNPNNAVLDEMENQRCTAIELNENHEAQENARREADRKEQAREHAETIAAVQAATPPPPPPSPPANACVRRVGHFATDYIEREGTCGPRKGRVDDVMRQPTRIDPPCSGEINYSADNCIVTFETVCPLSGGGTISTVARAEWAEDASFAKAVERVTARFEDGTSCSSIYDVTDTKVAQAAKPEDPNPY